MTTAPSERPDHPSDYLQGEAITLLDLLDRFAAEDFAQQFDERSGRIRCLTCRREHAPERIDLRALRRLEGASDPADMLAVVAIVCPLCRAKGTLVINFGPEATAGEAEMLSRLPEPEAGGVDHF